MKKFKIICLAFIFMFVCACSNTPSYTRDETAGEYIRISYAQLKQKVENDENFMVLFTQKGCDHCAQYKETVLSSYLETHHVDVYEFVLSNEENYNQEFFTEIQNYTASLTKDENQQFIGTPYTMIVKDGELKEGISGAIAKNDLEEIVVKYQLDELQEYTRDIASGEYIPISFASLKEKIENDDSFFVIFTQNGCEHCKEYKETVLNPYLENHHIDIYEFILSNEENYGKEVYDAIAEYTCALSGDELKQFIGTPYTMVIRAGNLVEGISGSLTEAHLENIVKDYKLDRVK